MLVFDERGETRVPRKKTCRQGNVTKISSCRINTTSRWGINQLGFSFGSIFLLFSFESSQGPRS